MVLKGVEQDLVVVFGDPAREGDVGLDDDVLVLVDIGRTKLRSFMNLLVMGRLFASSSFFAGVK